MYVHGHKYSYSFLFHSRVPSSPQLLLLSYLGPCVPSYPHSLIPHSLIPLSTHPFDPFDPFVSSLPCSLISSSSFYMSCVVFVDTHFNVNF